MDTAHGGAGSSLPTRDVPALGLAPRRNLLTKIMGPGVGAAIGIPYRLPITFFAAVPIEAPCYAVRLGFVNIFDFPLIITGASIHTSDSYSQCAAMVANPTPDPWSLAPTGAASAGTRVTFDCGGSPNPRPGTQMVNDQGSTYSYTLPADPRNSQNESKPATFRWSDFVPVFSVPQASAPSGPHILFIYITIGSPNMVLNGSNWLALAADPKAAGRRQYYGAIASEEGVDYTTSPTATAFRRCHELPQFALQYLTASFGVQCVTVGDSLSASPLPDQFSTPIWRAAADLSTQAMPIEVASLLLSGAKSTIYNVSLQNNAAAIRPSILFAQPLSRNDGPTTATLLTLLARSLAQAHELQSLYGTRLVLHSPGCQPSFEGNPTALGAFTELLGRLRAIGAAGVIPHIDGPSVMGLPETPWKYLPGISDDNMHFNGSGAELMVPLVKDALRRLIGI